MDDLTDGLVAATGFEPVTKGRVKPRIVAKWSRKSRITSTDWFLTIKSNEEIAEDKSGLWAGLWWQ